MAGAVALEYASWHDTGENWGGGSRHVLLQTPVRAAGGDLGPRRISIGWRGPASRQIGPLQAKSNQQKKAGAPSYAEKSRIHAASTRSVPSSRVSPNGHGAWKRVPWQNSLWSVRLKNHALPARWPRGKQYWAGSPNWRGKKKGQSDFASRTDGQALLSLLGASRKGSKHG